MMGTQKKPKLCLILLEKILKEDSKRIHLGILQLYQLYLNKTEIKKNKNKIKKQKNPGDSWRSKLIHYSI